MGQPILMFSWISPSGSYRISMLSDISVRQLSFRPLMQQVSSQSGLDCEGSGPWGRDTCLRDCGLWDEGRELLRMPAEWMSTWSSLCPSPGSLNYLINQLVMLLLSRSWGARGAAAGAHIFGQKSFYMASSRSVRIYNNMSKGDKGGQWNWVQQGTCLVGSSPGLKHSAKVASFDMDDTIITRKSGAKFPKDADDWIILNDKVAPKVKRFSDDGFKIIIFTNQAGIQKGHTNAEHIKTKVANVAKAFGVEMQVFVASHEDEFRKPGTGMWTLFTEKFNDKQKVDMKVSYYCGDAAGRKDGKHKDFSDSDYKFALNVGIPFLTPQCLFLGQVDKLEVKGFNPTTVPEEGEVIIGKGNKVAFEPKQLVIMVGGPGSGKSTFCTNFLPEYVRVNRDTLKTKEKCYKVADENLSQGKSVVIDNTNPKAEDRKYFIGLAKKHGAKVRCFEMMTVKDVCFHNDYQRVANGTRKHLSGKAGSIPIHTFFKYKEEPTVNEGFYEVNKVNFIAKFTSDQDKDFYRKFSKK